MGGVRPLTPEKQAELAEEYTTTNTSVRKLAQKHGLGRGQVYNALRRLAGS